MATGFDGSEIFTLAADLRSGTAQVKQKAGAAVRKTAADIAKDAKSLAPVDTGNLKSSIGTTKVGPLEMEVGPTASYGIYQELGTSRQPGTPFMGPAADRQIPAFLEAIGQVADGLIP